MRRQWDLAGRWTLRGWRQHDWERGTSFMREMDGTPDVPAIPAAVPGSVRGALVAAGVVPDPHVGRASRDSEWIENRHWTLSTTLPTDVAEALVDALSADPDARLVLHAESLDYAGAVLVDDTVVGTFRGALTPRDIDVTDAVRDGGRLLTLVFTDLPDDLGQIGRTSRIRAEKARYNYGWDWTPRVVQVGVAGPIALDLRPSRRLADVQVTTELAPDGAGRVTLDVGTTGLGRLRVRVTGPDVDVATELTGSGVVDVGAVRTWHVAGAGGQARYDVVVELLTDNGDVIDSATRRVGFRRIEWQATDGAPAGSEPWICVVNGIPTFLAGVNWVPIRNDHADVTVEDYRTRLTIYRDMGVVLLRVWGGAGLEQPVFYDLCDELGLLVWQELPLSSSGLDNTPPSDPEFADYLAGIAHSYAIRRMHHPCLILWGGGNELGDRDADGKDVPLTYAHPALAAAREVFATLDPTRRFVATSPTGPRPWADPAEYGTGVHHDVHGPWDQFSSTMAEWRAYWDADDSTLRSEVGVGGASAMALLERYGLTGPTATPEDRGALHVLWSHSSAWWLPRFAGWDGDGELADWVAESQRRQADLLAYAADATRRRFPAVGGFIVWLGHDAFPCAVSLALIDFDGVPKPAAYAVAEVFGGKVGA